MEYTPIQKTKLLFTSIATLLLVACSAAPTLPATSEIEIPQKNTKLIKATSVEADFNHTGKQDKRVEISSSITHTGTATALPDGTIQRTSTKYSKRPVIPSEKALKIHSKPISLRLPE